METFWGLDKFEQDSFATWLTVVCTCLYPSRVTHNLPLSYTLNPTATELHTIFAGGHAAGSLQFTFVGQEVGRECLCALMGIGVNRFKKTLKLQPDLRFGHDKSGSKRDTASVDAFLTVLYNGVAETLPDRLLISM